MGEIDRKAQSDYFIPGIVLMENAGIKLYNSLLDNVWEGILPEKTVFIAGKGNNGGDSLVMARQHFLNKGTSSVIIPDSSFREGLVKTHLDSCRALGIDIIDWSEEKETACACISDSEWIIEGLSGTGLKGELGNIPAEITGHINISSAKVCSIDIPSGIGDSYIEGYCAVDADITLTVEIPKLSLLTPSGRKKCGKIICVPIGFPPDLTEDDKIKNRYLEFEDLKSLINPPSPYSYKNTKGHTLILAGSEGMTGAAILCASAALNSLSGLVTLKLPKELISIPNISPSIITGTEDYSCFDKSSLEKYSAAAVGPGWGISVNKKKWLKSLLSQDSIPCVIDADALNLLSELVSEGFVINNSRSVITPHIGEFSRLTGLSGKEIQDNPLEIIRSFSEKHNTVTVLKSHVIWISSPDGRITVIDGSNSAMATAGSGDVLAGIISALLSYGLSCEDAASAGVLIHQYAGLLCYNEEGFFKSEKLAEYAGKALRAVFSGLI